MSSFSTASHVLIDYDDRGRLRMQTDSHDTYLSTSGFADGFDTESGRAFTLVLSDGTMLRYAYANRQLPWRVTLMHQGTARIEITPSPQGEIVRIHGEISWIGQLVEWTTVRERA